MCSMLKEWPISAREIPPHGWGFQALSHKKIVMKTIFKISTKIEPFLPPIKNELWITISEILLRKKI